MSSPLPLSELLESVTVGCTHSSSDQHILLRAMSLAFRVPTTPRSPASPCVLSVNDSNSNLLPVSGRGKQIHGFMDGRHL